MPPKKTARSSSVYLVVIGNVIDSVHASFETANSRSTEAKDKGKDNVRVEIQQLVGGTVTLEPAVEKEIPARVKVIKTESVDDAPKAITAEKKTKVTKPPAEQRVANASKPKGTKGDEDLPDNVKALLKANGDVLNGFAIVVTGVPPVLGRKNAEKLVQLYGGKLTKSLSKNTSFVVVGNDAGPTKLEKISELGIQTWDENDLISKLEGAGGSGLKQSDNDDEEDDEDEDEEDEEEVPKIKKQKT